MGIIDDFLGKDKKTFTGWMGETFTEFELMIVKIFGRDGKMLRNVYIPKDDGTYSEIDVLYITKKGIFVIESKNFSGWIFGDENSKNWTVSLPNNQKHQFYNPIKQNASHIKSLCNYLNKSAIKYFSIIAFSDRCELKKVPQLSNIPVINRHRLYSVIRNMWDNNTDILSSDDVTEIWNKLNDRAHQDDAVKKQHIENIKENNDSIVASVVKENEHSNDNRVSAGTIIPEISEVIDDFYTTKAKLEKPVCPRCGSELVLRTAKKGEYKMNRFYGCSSFPKCRFIKNIDD